ncbi:MAG: hypothetical protein AB7K52_05280 [Phycisphaerales bacterium]
MTSTQPLNTVRPDPPSGPVRAATPGESTAHWTGWLLSGGFLLLAGGLLVASRRPDIPIEPPAAIAHADLAPGPRRETLADPPSIHVYGVPQTCNGCHQIFASASAARAELTFHQDIRLNHGLNDRCVNCHDERDRERLTLRDGTTVPFAETPMLCAQCHGTVFRDWQRGTHGKTLGSWVTGAPEQQRLNCNQCHDPHSPRYDPYVPLPGPRTLRMGASSSQPAHIPASESPLQRWLHREHPSAKPDQVHDGGHP